MGKSNVNAGANMHASRRLQQDYLRLLRDPVPYILALPLPDNILEWHYVVLGPDDSPYAGGFYHGRLVFPKEFPFKPPSIYMITPNGRFHCNTRLCLSISDFHPDTWNPAWTVSSILTGLLSFMLETSPTLGSVETSTDTKRELAQRSLEFNLKNSTFVSLFPDLAKKGKHFELFTSQDDESLTQWKQQGSNNIKRIYDDFLHTYVISLEGNTANTKIQLPESSKKSLSIEQRFLLLQLYIPLQSDISFEFCVSDVTNTRHQIILSTLWKEASCSNLHARIPLPLEVFSQWFNFILDLAGLLQQLWHGLVFKSLDRLCITARCHLSKVVTLHDLPTLDDSEWTIVKETDTLALNRLLSATSDDPLPVRFLQLDSIRHALTRGDSMNSHDINVGSPLRSGASGHRGESLYHQQPHGDSVESSLDVSSLDVVSGMTTTFQPHPPPSSGDSGAHLPHSPYSTDLATPDMSPSSQIRRRRHHRVRPLSNTNSGAASSSATPSSTAGQSRSSSISHAFEMLPSRLHNPLPFPAGMKALSAGAVEREPASSLFLATGVGGNDGGNEADSGVDRGNTSSASSGLPARGGATKCVSAGSVPTPLDTAIASHRSNQLFGFRSPPAPLSTAQRVRMHRLQQQGSNNTVSGLGPAGLMQTVDLFTTMSPARRDMLLPPLHGTSGIVGEGLGPRGESNSSDQNQKHGPAGLPRLMLAQTGDSPRAFVPRLKGLGSNNETVGTPRRSGDEALVLESARSSEFTGNSHRGGPGHQQRTAQTPPSQPVTVSRRSLRELSAREVQEKFKMNMAPKPSAVTPSPRRSHQLHAYRSALDLSHSQESSSRSTRAHLIPGLMRGDTSASFEAAILAKMAEEDRAADEEAQMQQLHHAGPGAWVPATYSSKSPRMKRSGTLLSSYSDEESSSYTATSLTTASPTSLALIQHQSRGAPPRHVSHQGVYMNSAAGIVMAPSPQNEPDAGPLPPNHPNSNSSKKLSQRSMSHHSLLQHNLTIRPAVMSQHANTNATASSNIRGAGRYVDEMRLHQPQPRRPVKPNQAAGLVRRGGRGDETSILRKRGRSLSRPRQSEARMANSSPRTWEETTMKQLAAAGNRRRPSLGEGEDETSTTSTTDRSDCATNISLLLDEDVAFLQNGDDLQQQKLRSMATMNHHQHGETLALLYDTSLNCFYDPVACKYYELA